MEKILEKLVTISIKGGVVEIRHNKTKMVVLVPYSQLERWAIAQLRKELAK